MALIDRNAHVDPTAVLAEDVVVEAFAVVGPRVSIGAGSRIASFARVVCNTRLGERNHLHSHAVIGGDPQDKKFKGEETWLEIGDDNTFREAVTVNRGTVQDGGVTRVGSRNWVMAYVHIAHDCQVGSDTILANAVQLAGHVRVGDFAILGGLTGVHQFVQVGAHSMSGAGTTLLQDLPPYVMCNGNPAEAHGLNSEGLRRRGYTESQISLLKRAYRLVYKSGLGLEAAIAELQTLEAGASDSDLEVLRRLTGFLQGARRGIVR